MFRRVHKLVCGPVAYVATQAAGLSASQQNTNTALSLSGWQALDLSNLRCEFVVKTKLGKPSHADIKVYNASASTRAFLGATGTVGVSLSAGYQDTSTTELFLGEIISAPTYMQGPNYVTRFESTDKTLALRSCMVAISIPPGASVYYVIKQWLAAVNANAGTIKSATIGEGHATKTLTASMPTLWPRGGLLQGYARNVLDDVCKSAGLIWSIDHGSLFLTLQAGDKGHGNPILLTSSSGLIESPANDGKGVFSFRTLIMGGISLGRIVQIQSRFVNGHFRILECDTHGDSFGAEWSHHCKAAPVMP